MSARQFGTVDSFSVSESETSGGLRLRAQATGNTGQIGIRAVVEDAGIDTPGPQLSLPQMELEVLPTGLVDTRNSIRRIPDILASQIGASSSVISSLVTSTSFPSVDRFNSSETIDTGTQLPVDETFSVDFAPIVIPDSGEILDNIHPASITVQLTPTGFLLRGIVSSLPSVELEIPPEAFVSTVNVSQFSCAELFSDVDTRVDELNQRATRLRQRVSDFEGVRGAQVISEIESLGSDIRSGLSRVESEISNIGLPRCQSNLENRLDPVRNQLEGFERIELEGPLDCADFSQFEELSLQQFRTVRSAIRGAEEMATSPQTMTESRLNRILDRVEDSREHVRQNVDEDNPCFEQIMDRLDEAESTSERLLSDVELPEQLSCEAAYSTIDSRLESFENNALSADPPIDRESFEFMVNRADNLIRRVRDEIPSEDQRCKEQFIERINGIISRIGRVGARTRIITAEELSREEITERQEVLQDIEGRLDEIRQAGEGLPSREEFLSERDGLNSPLF